MSTLAFVLHELYGLFLDVWETYHVFEIDVIKDLTFKIVLAFKESWCDPELLLLRLKFVGEHAYYHDGSSLVEFVDDPKLDIIGLMAACLVFRAICIWNRLWFLAGPQNRKPTVIRQKLNFRLFCWDSFLATGREWTSRSSYHRRQSLLKSHAQRHSFKWRLILMEFCDSGFCIWSDWFCPRQKV